MFKNKYLTGVEGQFAPRASLSGKQNYCRHLFIEQDGGVAEVVRLNVLDDRHREDIIGFHFAQQYAKIHYGEQFEQPQFYIVGRDSPWDFEYVMHDGTNFFVEICRVADKDLLKAMKIENDVTLLLRKSELTGFDIRKVEKHFPGTLPRDLVEKVRTKADMRRKFSWKNTDIGPKVFLRPPISPRLNIRKELESALRKKAAKRHAGKGRTNIILDNLTTHSGPGDFFVAVEEIAASIESLPFKSVWLYTGYYSDNDGYNCEFSLVPIKVSDDEAKYLVGHGSK